MNLSKLLTKELACLYVIVLLGFFFIFQGVLTNSFAFTYDVGRDMLMLADMAKFHKVPLIGATTGLPGIFYGPWWYYILFPFFLLFGGNPQGIAGVMAMLLIVCIILGYVIGKKIGGGFLGLSIATMVFITSASPVVTTLSSQIWNPNIAPICAFLIIIVLIRIYSDKKYKSINFFFLGLLLALSIDSEIVYGTLLSLGIVLALGLVKKFKFPLTVVPGFLIGVFIIISPRVLFELRHNFLMTNALIKFIGTSDSSSPASGILQTLANRLNIFTDQFSQTISAGNKNIAIAVLALVILGVGLFYKKASQLQKDFIKTSSIVILIFFLGTTFFSHDIWPHYLVGLPVFYILLVSIMLNLFAINFKNYILPTGFLIFILLLNFNPIVLIANMNKPLWEGDAAVYRNQLAVIDYVYASANHKAFKYVVYTPPVYDYTYQYLFRWYGPEKYHYSPSIKAGIAYFILEPDFENPARLTNWLISRAGDGKIINSKIVKGGITVQTRDDN